MQFKLLGNTFRLSDRHHVEGELLKDTMISESVRFGKHLAVDRRLVKSKKEGFLDMVYCYISKFSETITADALTKHKSQQVIPMRQTPLLGFVIISVYDSFE